MGNEWGEWPYLTELIDAIAPQFGANPDELVLSRNTTDGMCSIIGGLNLQKGDEILTTHHEHIAAISPLTIVQERFGVTVKELEIPVFPENEDEFVELFDANVSNQTKLIVFSHITYKTGTRLPAKRICEEVGQYYKIPTLIDGAHAPGMINLDVHNLGCDFYAGSGHKWQCGPGATGFLYMRDNNERLKEYWPDRSPVYWPLNGSLYPYAAFIDLATQVQYVGQDNYPAKRALKDVCDFWDKIGRQRIEDYVLSLSAHCKQRIRKVFGDIGTLFSPDIPELSSGLTAFNPFEDPTDSTNIVTFRDRLRDEYGFSIRYTNFKIKLDDLKDNYALRISTHLFHNHQQVEDLVDAMYDLYLDMI
jgi:selenocysteine lyase/cysteine desulfurase